MILLASLNYSLHETMRSRVDDFEPQVSAMNLGEYATYDALGLAALVRNRDVSARELGELALDAIERLNPTLNCVLETFPERVAALAGAPPPAGTFGGVPTLLKDIYKFEKGTLSEGGSQLTQGLRGWVRQRGGSAAASRGSPDPRPIHGPRAWLVEHQRYPDRRADPKSVEPRYLSRRFQQRGGGGGRCRHRADRACE